VEPVIDAEVLSDESTFAPDLPLMGSVSGWCNDGKHTPDENSKGCPGIFGQFNATDKSRKGATFLIPARRCPCWCHSRDLH
jgi:hypothetical protein